MSKAPMVFFSHLPEPWGVTSMVLDNIPLTVLHKMNYETDDPVDTTLTCASYTIPKNIQAAYLADILQERIERKSILLKSEYFIPHTEVGEVHRYSNVDFTILGGTYASEETGVIIQTSYLSLEETEAGFNVIEIATTVPLQHMFESEPQIEEILNNIIVATV